MPKVRTVSHGRIKERRKAHPKHLARIRAMLCLVPICYEPAEAHHVIGYADKAGRAPKRDDRVVPLCSFHHRDGPHAVHAINHRGFYREYRIDLMAVAVRLWEESNDRL
jgi:hypothetical protein